MLGAVCGGLPEGGLWLGRLATLDAVAEGACGASVGAGGAGCSTRVGTGAGSRGAALAATGAVSTPSFQRSSSVAIDTPSATSVTPRLSARAFRSRAISRSRAASPWISLPAAARGACADGSASC